MICICAGCGIRIYLKDEHDDALCADCKERIDTVEMMNEWSEE